MNPTKQSCPGGSSPTTGSAFFGLGQVLSITTGRLLCDMGEVYEILNHITGDNLFTHALPRANRFAAPLVLELFPQLRKAEEESNQSRLDALLATTEKPMDAVKEWLASLDLPESFELPTWADAWLAVDPLAELEAMKRPGQEVIVVPPQNLPSSE
jgi:hypothetical protein